MKQRRAVSDSEASSKDESYYHEIRCAVRRGVPLRNNIIRNAEKLVRVDHIVVIKFSNRSWAFGSSARNAKKTAEQFLIKGLRNHLNDEPDRTMVALVAALRKLNLISEDAFTWASEKWLIAQKQRMISNRLDWVTREARKIGYKVVKITRAAHR